MTARSALRSATADAHQRVDDIYARFRLGDPQGYRAFLRATAAAFRPVEAALDEAGAARVLDDWRQRRRGALIVADLERLGEPLEPLAPFPPIAGAPAILGAIYVLEGSRLGGAMLKRSLPPGAPRAFLDAPAAPGAWRRLGFVLEEKLSDPIDLIEAIDAALQVFDRFAVAGHAALEPAQ